MVFSSSSYLNAISTNLLNLHGKGGFDSPAAQLGRDWYSSSTLREFYLQGNMCGQAGSLELAYLMNMVGTGSFLLLYASAVQEMIEEWSRPPRCNHYTVPVPHTNIAGESYYCPKPK